ncbi:PAS domain S-box-containing protein [Malonomonas rubra DSM 5091]|uniref:histidine kinase n=1 Tax=Malonomonas rubra DSM 5091 TaxID=1122189 RepID=A0A1M6N051_MALRU|nr:PAS domain-containing sensor histidine kinase [Malonomonas rubra]SHJ88993.1 PAS domain S-box-containing protein [Malonomonas rubra DSM 5091]
MTLLPKEDVAFSLQPEPYFNQLLRLTSFFLLGAFFLSTCATLQKLLFSLPLEWRGYPIPLLAGGSCGLIVGSAVYHHKQSSYGRNNRNLRGREFYTALIRQVLQFSLFFAVGALLLCLLSLLQKSLAGYPIELRMFTIPTLFGGFSGVSVGWYLLELSRSNQYRLADERQYYNLFENANDMIQIVSLDGRLLYANKAWKKTLGYQDADLSQVNIFQVMHPDCLAETQQKMRRMLKGEQVERMELKYLTREGDELIVEGSSSISLVRGKPVGFRCILRDISERKRNEQKLKQALLSSREAHHKLDHLLSAVVDGILLIDKDRKIQLANPAAARLLRIKREQLLQRKLYDAISFLPIGLVEDPSCKDFILKVPVTEQQEQRFLHALLSRQGDGSAILSLHDVTQEKELDRMKNEFISTAAHELRTPLTSIMGFSEYFLSSPPETSEEGVKMMTTIHDQAQALSAIISDLLDLSRIESGRGFILQKSFFSMPQLIEQTISQMAPSKAHPIQLQLGCGDVQLSGDRGKLRQLIENIVGNAIKYSPDGGEIKVRGALRGDHYVLQVSDCGIGMTAEQTERVFEKFYRADYANTAISGIGLGMSIVQRIVQAHGGLVRIKSKPGRGTRVTVFLPRLAA